MRIPLRRAQVLKLTLKGWSQQDIADELGCSRGTIARDQKALQERVDADIDATIAEWRADFADLVSILVVKAIKGLDDMDGADAIAALAKIAPIALRLFGVDRMVITSGATATEQALIAYHEWMAAQLAQAQETDPQGQIPADNE